MVDDLYAGSYLEGLDYDGVVQLLGEPDSVREVAEDGRRIVIYWVGPERSLFSIDSEWLTIIFDESGTLVRILQTTD